MSSGGSGAGENIALGKTDDNQAMPLVESGGVVLIGSGVVRTSASSAFVTTRIMSGTSA